jgi:transmembrane protein EpsG
MTHLVFLFALACVIPQTNRRLPFFIFTILSLFLFLALRYDYGNDYMGYLQLHSDINAGLKTRIDSDFLYRISNILFPNFFVFVIILAVIYIFCICLLIYSNLDASNSWLGFLLLTLNPQFFLVHLSSFRQTMAICAFIISIHFLKNKKRFLCFLFILIAAGFHKSALLLLPVPFFLNKQRICWKHYCIVILIIYIFLATPFLDFIINKLFIWLPQFHSYTYYIEQETGNALRGTITTSLLALFVLKYINKLHCSELFYGKLALIGYIITIVAYKISALTRISMYFDIFSVVALPMIYIRNRSSIACKIYSFIIFMIFLLRYFLFFNHPVWQASYNQYKSVFSLLF